MADGGVFESGVALKRENSGFDVDAEANVRTMVRQGRIREQGDLGSLKEFNHANCKCGFFCSQTYHEGK
jgi:hypothetical protein